jgi:uncharacterized protein (DUF924 family)
METQQTIKNYWFGSKQDDAAIAQDRSKLWWAKNENTDQYMRERFTAYVTKAANHELDAWATTAEGLLTLILLTDQFPRNIYRGTPQAFAFDTLAFTWCNKGLAAKSQYTLRPIERVFFYLPLEHSESLADQERSVMLFGELVEQADATHRQTFEGFLRFAQRHYDVIKRFGRFPHRNQILGRASSLEETLFLQEPGSSF